MLQKELLSKYETEVRKVWSTDEKMVKYCINNLSNLIELSDGSLYEIEKRLESEVISIDTWNNVRHANERSYLITLK